MSYLRLLIAVFVFTGFAVGAPAQETAAPLRKMPDSVADLAAGLLDAVVNISTSQTVRGTEETENPPATQTPDGSPFQELFKDFFTGKDGKQRSRTVQSLGSGFVIHAQKGLIVTNNHVIADADEIEVNFTDGTKLKAKLLGKDPKTDLALLQVTPGRKKLTAVTFGDSGKVRIGDWVMAIGNPFGFGGTVTTGIVSARNRNINAGPYDDFIQTDAAINRGNSGGPLFDMYGRVIGINTAIVSPSGGSIGIGFAIPSEMAVAVIDQLQEFGETRRGWLAIRVQPVSDEMAQALGLPNTRGALVSGRIANNSVDNKSLKDGDVIIRFAGKPVKDARMLPRIVAESLVGHKADVVVLRDGQEKTVQVKLGLLDETDSSDENTDMDDEEADDKGKAGTVAPADKDKKSTEQKMILLGMELAVLTDERRREFAVADDVSGVIVLAVASGSAADRKHIIKGNVIVDVNQEVVATPAAVARRIAMLKNTGRKNTLLMVAGTAGELRFVTLQLD